MKVKQARATADQMGDKDNSDKAAECCSAKGGKDAIAVCKIVFLHGDNGSTG